MKTHKSHCLNPNCNGGGMVVAWLLMMQAAAAGWAALPSAFTQPAVIWDTNTMMLRGVVHPQGETTAVWFEWGETMQLGNTTGWTYVEAEENLVWISQPLSGWDPRRVYYYQLVAINNDGVVRGTMQRFGAGRVVAWGLNDYGQTNVPVGLTNVVAAAGGMEHSLALRQDGTVVAWGRNNYGQTNVPSGLSNVVAIASGSYHNLALRKDGTVIAWGKYGQNTVPPGLSNVVAVSAGWEHNLALRQDGTVVAWGGNSAVPPGLSNVVAVAAGETHSLALRADGTVVAWGSNSAGQTTVPENLHNVVSVAAGGFHSSALLDDGTVVAWGHNVFGQTSVPASLSNVVVLTAGYYHNLALLADGTVQAWGYNGDGQAVVPDGLSEVMSVGVGRLHSFAIFGNYRPKSLPQVVLTVRGGEKVITLQGIDWDGNGVSFQVTALPEFGTLYQYTNGSRGEAITLPGTWVTDSGGRVIYAAPATGSGELVDGFSFAAYDAWEYSVPMRVHVSVDPLPLVWSQAAIYKEGSNVVLRGAVDRVLAPTGLWFEWGLTLEMGNQTAVTNVAVSNGLIPVRLPVSGWESRQVYYYRLVASNSLGIVRGAAQMFGVGKLVAWGANNYGQTTVPEGLSNVVALAAGYYHALALRQEGIVGAWGVNNYGQTNVPAELSDMVAVAAGGSHSLALREDGTVVAWGLNGFGQATVPAGLSNVVAIAAGGYHSLALREDGTVVAWGLDNHRQTNVPAGLTNVVAVAAGGWHSVALRSDGTVAAWGNNLNGQTNVPPGLSNVVAVAAGFSHSLALRQDGTVVAWGQNDYGQANVPDGLSNVVAIAAGVNHNLALRQDGTVVAWGQNNYGQATVPAGVSNVVAVAAGVNYTLALLGNYRPNALPQTLQTIRGEDKVIVLQAIDSSEDVLTFRITALPESGTLYQYAAGGRGEAITSSGTWVTDVGGRVIYAAPATGSGELMESFEFVAYDEWLYSSPARVKIYVDLPPRAWTHGARCEGEDNLVLRGTVTQLMEPTAVWFEWGTTMEMTNRTAVTNINGGEGLVRVNLPVSDWETRRAYYYQLVASNSYGVVRGAMQMFAVGRVVAWGLNDYGQTNVPAGLTNVVAVAGGMEHSLALRQDGTILAWGGNRYGQTNVPPGLSNVVAVSAGGYHNLALRHDGTLVAWGDNRYGQTDVPSGLSNVVAVAAGAYHNLALCQDGKLVAWGLSDYGEGTVPEGITNVVAMAAGAYHSLALKQDGNVVAWGSDFYGWTNVPVGLTNVVGMAVGGGQDLVLRQDGTLVGWGWNYSEMATPPRGLSNVVAVASGSYHNVTLLRDGKVVAWGNNKNGQTNVPAGLSNVVAVAAGGYHSLALVANYDPTSLPQHIYVIRGVDKVIALHGSDLDQDALSFRVTVLPTAGALYQYANGVRGEEITTPGSWVNDAAGRVIYAPPTTGSGVLEDGFDVVAHDGRADSLPSRVKVYVDAPPSAMTQGAWFKGEADVELRGIVHLRGAPATVWFEWGPTMELANRTAETQVDGEEGLVWVGHPVSIWQTRRVYYCQIVASNRYGVVRGSVQRFFSGRVVAWGRNNSKQTNTPGFLGNVVSVDARWSHNLALGQGGEVVSWGSLTNTPAGLSNVVAVAAGGSHNMVLQHDGTVTAWGGNAYGQRNVPAGLSNVVAIAAGIYHSLALRGDGKVVAWGYNGSEQMNPPPVLSDVVAVAAGNEHNLALLRDGTVVAWGFNTYGQTNVPPGLSNVVAVAAGGYHNLALRDDGTIVAWGLNGDGQTNIPAGLSNVVAVAAGEAHSLALRQDGTLVAWGNNNYGQTSVPSGLSNVVALAAGSHHSVALFGNYSPTAIPQTLTSIRGGEIIITLKGTDLNMDVLSFRVTALPEFGALYQYANGGRGEAITSPETWVTNSGGRLIYVPPATGIGELQDGFEFVAHDGEVDSQPARVAVYVDLLPYVHTQQAWYEGDASVVLRGSVAQLLTLTAVWFEWGPTMEMENVTVATNLLDGDRLIWVSQPVSGWEPRKTYYYRVVASNSIGVVRGAVQMFGTGQVVCWGGQTNVPVGLSHIAAVSAGGGHSLALRQDGTVVAWGNNSFGQTNVPAGLSNVVTVSAGASHSLALLKDGRVVAWGANIFGQTRVPCGLSNVVSVAAGAYHSLALQQDGTVQGWSYQAVTNMPPNLSNVVAVAAGNSLNVALRADGTVAAWSPNDYFGYAKVPIGLSNVVAIAAGGLHSLALRRDGTVVAWGLNNYGQTNVPAGLSNVVAIEAGEHHSLALRQDGTVVAWGRNDLGQASVPGSLTNVVAVSGGWGHNLALVMLPPIPPSIVSQPLSRTVRVGEGVSFCVGAQADPEPVYQWWFNGTNLLSEATGPCLMLTNVQPAHAGDYQVVVFNSVGSVTSAVARLTVATVWVGSVGLESGGRLSMALHTPPGRVCELWATTDLALPMSQWTLVTVLTNETGRLEWSAPVGAEPGRFYRIRMP